MSEVEMKIVATFFIASLMFWSGAQFQSLFFVLCILIGELYGFSWYVMLLALLVANFINLLVRGVFKAAGG